MIHEYMYQNSARLKFLSKVLIRHICILLLWNSDQIVILIQAHHYNLVLSIKCLRKFEMNNLKGQQNKQQCIQIYSNYDVSSPSSNQVLDKTGILNEQANSFLPLESIVSSKFLNFDEKQVNNNDEVDKSSKQKKSSEQNTLEGINKFPLVEIRQLKKDTNALNSKYNESEKSNQHELILQIPQLTGESLASSDEIEGDNESNNNEKSNICKSRFEIDKIFLQHSEYSDDIQQSQQKLKGLYPRQQYADSKSSDRSQSDDILNNCRNCYSSTFKYKQLQEQNTILKQKVQLLRLQLEKTKQNIRQNNNENNEEAIPILKSSFLNQMSNIYNNMQKVNKLLLSYTIDFIGKDLQILKKVNDQFKILEANLFQKQQKQQHKMLISKLHDNYKKLIMKLIKKNQEKDIKRNLQLRKFISIMNEKEKIQNQPSSNKVKQRSRKKSKFSLDKQQLIEDDLIRQLELSRQKIQWLQADYSNQRQRSRQLQKLHRQTAIKLSFQIQQMGKERNIFRYELKKRQRQFNDFMNLLSSCQTKKLRESQFFNNICNRIFEISNCIPFQENDEQNLFVPENEQELFNMIERIRSFYIKSDQSYLKREYEYQIQKKQLILFIKTLVRDSKVSFTQFSNLLKEEQFRLISYLRQIAFYEQKIENKAKQSQKFSLKIQKADSFTFNFINSETTMK